MHNVTEDLWQENEGENSKLKLTNKMQRIRKLSPKKGPVLQVFLLKYLKNF